MRDHSSYVAADPRSQKRRSLVESSPPFVFLIHVPLGHVYTNVVRHATQDGEVCASGL